MSEIRNVVQGIRENIFEMGFPLFFPDTRWGESEDFVAGNCFTYALNTTYSDDDISVVFEYCNSQCKKYSDKEVRKFFENIMRLINIDFYETTLNEELPENFYRIVLCNAFGWADYHLARQNDDGMWSHKCGWHYPPEFLCDAGEDPAKCLSEQFEYDLIAYYAVKKLE